jgi:hypothetical protein
MRLIFTLRERLELVQVDRDLHELDRDVLRQVQRLDADHVLVAHVEHDLGERAREVVVGIARDVVVDLGRVLLGQVALKPSGLVSWSNTSAWLMRASSASGAEPR